MGKNDRGIKAKPAKERRLNQKVQAGSQKRRGKFCATQRRFLTCQKIDSKVLESQRRVLKSQIRNEKKLK